MGNKTFLVGLTGRAGAGKDTAASFLVANGWKQVSFAEPIRAFVASLLGCTVKDLNETGFKERPHAALGGKSPRFAMQTLGTEWGRNTINPDLWLDLAMRKAAEQRFEGFAVVISDVRLDIEAKAIIASGGRVFEIVRPGDAIACSGHITEAGIDASLIAATIDNSGDFEQLARSLARELGLGGQAQERSAARITIAQDEEAFS